MPTISLAAPQDQASLNVRCRLQCSISNFLEADDFASPRKAVGGDQQFCFGIPQPRGNGLRPEAGKEGDVDRTELAAGKDGHHRLRHHRQKDAHPVPTLDAQPAKGIGNPVGLGRELGKRQAAGGAVVALPDDGDPVPAPLRHMAVERGVDVVEAAIDPPSRPRLAVVQVENARVWLMPGETEVAVHGSPIAGRIGSRPVEQRLIAVDTGPIAQRLEPALLNHLRRWAPRGP